MWQHFRIPGWSLYIKEMDVVHVLTYPARSSTLELAAGWGPFKQQWCSKCSALSPFWSSHILWQMEEAGACRQLGGTACGSEAKQSSCNSSHTLPGRPQTTNIGIHIWPPFTACSYWQCSESGGIIMSFSCFSFLSLSFILFLTVWETPVTCWRSVCS